jgi:truncated hemoglobin YjbI
MTSATRPKGAAGTGLFDRLGGFEAIEQAVQHLFARLAADPALCHLLPEGDRAEACWQAQLLLTDRLGGPMAYDGPEPARVRARLGIDAAEASALLEHILRSLATAGADSTALAGVREVLLALGREAGLGTSPVAPPTAPPPVADPATPLVAAAEATAARAGLAGWNLFVLTPQLTLVQLNASARAAVAAVDGELNRAFGLRASQLLGESVLRFHPAPTRLQGLLANPARLPHEIGWNVGRAFWRARLLAVRSDAGALLGFAIAWKDETELYRAEATFARLRSQAEDLPVPVMFPEATLERWFGNAACDHALERLAPHLAFPVNPLTGVPIELFLPDAVERQAIFGDPDRLPFKRQLRIGPETVALLVTAVRDEEQRYLGPQITWEIVHFTRPAPGEPRREAPTVPAAPTAEPPAGPGVVPAPPSTAATLRFEARGLEQAAQELLTLTRLIDSVADDAEGQAHTAPLAGEAAPSEGEGEAAAQQAEAALAVLSAIREMPAGRRRDEATRALQTLTGVARQANLLALDGALLAVRDDADDRAASLAEAARALASGLATRIRALSAQAEESSVILRQSEATAARLAGLRTRLGDAGAASP